MNPIPSKPVSPSCTPTSQPISLISLQLQILKETIPHNGGDNGAFEKQCKKLAMQVQEALECDKGGIALTIYTGLAEIVFEQKLRQTGAEKVIFREFDDIVPNFTHSDYFSDPERIQFFAKRPDSKVAAYYYAQMLFEGRGVEKNSSEASRYYSKAAELGYVPPTPGIVPSPKDFIPSDLAFCITNANAYLNGDETKEPPISKDLTLASVHLNKAAQLNGGVAEIVKLAEKFEAQHTQKSRNFTRHLTLNFDFDGNLEKARLCYEIAAKNGNKEACLWVTKMKANQGDQQAMVQIAQFYFNVEGPKSPMGVKGKEDLIRLANAGIKEALFALLSPPDKNFTLLPSETSDTNRHDQTAAEVLSQAAKIYLGKSYSGNPLEGDAHLQINKNEELGLLLLDEVTKMGKTESSEPAAMILGNFYRFESENSYFSSSANRDLAMHYYKRAGNTFEAKLQILKIKIAEGDISAIYECGELNLEHSKNFPDGGQHLEFARDYFMQAADKKHPEAALKVARMHEKYHTLILNDELDAPLSLDNFFIPSRNSLQEALKYYQIADEGRHPEAKTALNRLTCLLASPVSVIKSAINE